jgi:hypothetical protein
MWDLSRTNSRELPKVLGITGGPPGSRSRHLRIKRGMRAFSDGCCTPVPIEVVQRFRRSCTPRKVVTLALA